ncbi:hypothetical protein Tdes44962_MAKER00951 [Teratosphaeria destructans]|uniref:DUF4336 domain-containing protein n=1 Tax=Teratosphaeria destructans TaxID=418781 RepID=A0A9W7VYV0_9PEZI|nr:hypothetical protein Tdes44962_MAKER00951 [Teratosphaeria destructans]
MASSASKLIPANPEQVMLIRHVTPDIKICSTPFLRFGHAKIGGRATVVRLASGNLAVFSPVALTDALRRELASFGTGQIRYITALDQEHHIFLEPWHKQWPHATVIAPETLPKYREKQNYFRIPDDRWALFRKDSKGRFPVSDEFDREFDVEYVHAHANQELVFNHKPSRTLIEADLLFNLPATEQFSRTDVSPTSGIITKLMNTLQSAQGDALWQKRILWYAIAAGDRRGFNASVSKIARWDFDKIIPCHGDVIESDGKGIFDKVMEWHLNAAKKEIGSASADGSASASR